MNTTPQDRPLFFKPGAFQWDSLGYFYRTDFGRSANQLAPSSNIWIQLDSLIELATQGSFDRVPEAFALLEYNTQSWLFSSACAVFIGDACPTAELRSYVDQRMLGLPELSVVGAVELARTLASTTALWSVPYLLALSEAFQDETEGDVIPILLSELLEPTYSWLADGPRGQPNFRQRAMNTYEEKASLFGTTDVTLFLGEILGTQRIAKELLRVAELIPVPSVRLQVLRHRFEASTGVNCSGFFTNGQPMPDRIEQIVKRFLSSATKVREDGRRHFFGHFVR